MRTHANKPCNLLRIIPFTVIINANVTHMNASILHFRKHICSHLEISACNINFQGYEYQQEQHSRYSQYLFYLIIFIVNVSNVSGQTVPAIKVGEKYLELSYP
jgi:hypothetical protein